MVHLCHHWERSKDCWREDVVYNAYDVAKSLLIERFVSHIHGTFPKWHEVQIAMDELQEEQNGLIPSLGIA